MPQNKPIYYTVFDWMIQECRLKGGAERDIYALLYSLADKNGIARVSLGYLAERTGYTDRGVKKAISNLMESGWVMKSRDSHYGINGYVICEPASIIGRFGKSEKTEEQSSRDFVKTEEQSSREQRNGVPLKMEQSSPDTPYIYFYNKIYNNFFITDDPSEKKEKEILLEEFFITFGIYQPMDEVMRFWAYHEQTGWRNGKGQRIVNKKAAAQFWRLDEKCLRQSELAKKIITRLYQVIPQEQKMCFIADLVNIVQERDTVTIICKSERLMNLIEGIPKVLSAMTRILTSLIGNNVRLLYRKHIQQTN